MSTLFHNPAGVKQLAPATVALLAVGGLVAYAVYKEKKEEEEAFRALAEEVELADFDLLTFMAKGGALMGDLHVTGIQRLLKDGEVEDDLGVLHTYKSKKAWIVAATIHGDPVTLLVRRNGTVELLTA